MTYENRDDYYTWSWIEEYPGTSRFSIVGELVRAAVVRMRRRAKRTSARRAKAIS